MDKQAFQNACEFVRRNGRDSAGIGTLSEKTLHAVLKRYYEPDEGGREIKIGSYVADIVGENGIIEIQTQGFDKLRAKLAAFLEVARVTVVYPVSKTKWLCWIDGETGTVTKKRKSPKTGTVFDAFFELYKIKPLLKHPNLSLCIVLLETEEYRRLDGWSKDKKKGSSRYERIPMELLAEIPLNNTNDYIALLPESLPESFTGRDFAKAAKIRPRAAQMALHILYYAGAVERVGKQGNAFVYRRSGIADEIIRMPGETAKSYGQFLQEQIMIYKDEYESWAENYDLFGEIETVNEAERDFLHSILSENGVKSVLDCACGTGQHLLMLSALGYRMAGSDYSSAMLEVCRKNLDKAGEKAVLKQADYRELDAAWPQAFDAVLCMTQALNHMLTKEDLLTALVSMRRKLKPGGVLIITQSTTHKTLGDEYQFSLVANNRDCSRILARDIDGEQQTVHILDILHGEERSGMVRHDVRIKIILDEEYRELLTEAGFSAVDIYGGYDRQPYQKESSWKLIVAAKA